MNDKFINIQLKKKLIKILITCFIAKNTSVRWQTIDTFISFIGSIRYTYTAVFAQIQIVCARTLLKKQNNVTIVKRAYRTGLNFINFQIILRPNVKFENQSTLTGCPKVLASFWLKTGPQMKVKVPRYSPKEQVCKISAKLVQLKLRIVRFQLSQQDFLWDFLNSKAGIHFHVDLG